jgi:hypothetical protein
MPKLTDEAKAFWLSEKAGDTINYPWDAAASFAEQKKDDLLDVIAQWRDQHLKQAAHWQEVYENRLQKSKDKGALADASGMIERNNFAAVSLSQLLIKVQILEQGGIVLEKEKKQRAKGEESDFLFLAAALGHQR